MSVIIKPSQQSCLCQKILNFKPQVVSCEWEGEHPNPQPHQKGIGVWHWITCRTCKTKTHVSDHYQAALSEWAMLNRNELQHRTLWLRDYQQRQEKAEK